MLWRQIGVECRSGAAPLGAGDHQPRAIVTDLDAARPPAGRDVTDHVRIRTEGDDAHRVQAGLGHVKQLLIRGERQRDGLDALETAIRAGKHRQRDLVDDPLALIIEHGDRVVVAVRHVGVSAAHGHGVGMAPRVGDDAVIGGADRPAGLDDRPQRRLRGRREVEDVDRRSLRRVRAAEGGDGVADVGGHVATADAVGISKRGGQAADGAGVDLLDLDRLGGLHLVGVADPGDAERIVLVLVADRRGGPQMRVLEGARVRHQQRALVGRDLEAERIAAHLGVPHDRPEVVRLDHAARLVHAGRQQRRVDGMDREAPLIEDVEVSPVPGQRHVAEERPLESHGGARGGVEWPTEGMRRSVQVDRTDDLAGRSVADPDVPGLAGGRVEALAIRRKQHAHERRIELDARRDRGRAVELADQRDREVRGAAVDGGRRLAVG